MLEFVEGHAAAVVVVDQVKHGSRIFVAHVYPVSKHGISKFGGCERVAAIAVGVAHEVPIDDARSLELVVQPEQDHARAVILAVCATTHG